MSIPGDGNWSSQRLCRRETLEERAKTSYQHRRLHGSQAEEILEGSEHGGRGRGGTDREDKGGYAIDRVTAGGGQVTGARTSWGTNWLGIPS